MKILLGFITLVSTYGCGQTSSMETGKSKAVYIAGCDSIFFCKSQHLNSETLEGIKNDDSTFITEKVAEFEKSNEEIHIKIFGGYCGGTAGTAESFMHLLNKKNVKWRMVEPDSLEENYFNDISLVKAVQQIKIELNEPKEAGNLTYSKPFFQFLVKKNGTVYYSYDSTDMNRNLILVNNPTKEQLIQALNDVETKHNIKLKDEQIIIRGDALAGYPGFRVIKEALKTKELFRFRIVTGNAPSSKKPDVDIPILVTTKTLTLLLSGTDELYYYHGKDCSSMIKSTTEQIKTVLKNEKINTPLKDIMILIKQEESGSFKAVINILDEINLSKIPARHFAETEITASEINCIKNYKTK